MWGALRYILTYICRYIKAGLIVARKLFAWVRQVLSPSIYIHVHWEWGLSDKICCEIILFANVAEWIKGRKSIWRTLCPTSSQISGVSVFFFLIISIICTTSLKNGRLWPPKPWKPRSSFQNPTQSLECHSVILFLQFSLRLLENVRVRRAGYCYRQEYAVALER